MADTECARQTIAQITGMMQRCGMHVHPESGLCFFSGYSDSIFSCEVFYDTIALSHVGAGCTLALNTLRVYLGSAQKDGHIPRHWIGPVSGAQEYAYDSLEREEHAQPFLCQTALLISRAQGSASWLSTAEWTVLKQYLERWSTAWDQDHNGLSEWASAPHAMADTQFDRVGVWRSHFCEGVDLNCYLYLEFLAGQALAQALHLAGDAARFAREAERKKHLIQEAFWDDEDGYFYDRDIRTGEPIKVKAAEGFLPLWAGLASPEQAERLVDEHLTNPDEFWTPYPVPSYARSEPHYTQFHRPAPDSDPLWDLPPGHCNWRGGLWPHLNYMIAHGLAKYGFQKEAEHVAERSFELAASDPLLHEWYDAETGEGQGGHPFWAGIQALMGFLKAEIHAGFDPSEIRAVDAELGSAEVRRELCLPDVGAAGWVTPE
jgi:hypothetical protein